MKACKSNKSSSRKNKERSLNSIKKSEKVKKCIKKIKKTSKSVCKNATKRRSKSQSKSKSVKPKNKKCVKRNKRTKTLSTSRSRSRSSSAKPDKQAKVPCRKICNKEGTKRCLKRMIKRKRVYSGKGWSAKTGFEKINGVGKVMVKALSKNNVGTMARLKVKAETMTARKFTNFLKNQVCANKNQIKSLSEQMTFVKKQEKPKKDKVSSSIDVDQTEETPERVVCKPTGRTLLNMLSFGYASKVIDECKKE